MPANTVLLSTMMRELSAKPGFTAALLQQLGGASREEKKGPALLTPRLVDELRKRILGEDWKGLDRFPGWTMRQINPAVSVAGRVAGKAEVNTSGAARGAKGWGSQLQRFLDVGSYPLDREQVISLDEPSHLPGFSTDGIITPMGHEVARGDGPNSLAPEHAESQRLADALNRLAANALNSTAPFAVTIGGHPSLTPEGLVKALVATGHQVTVIDARYFANFGHLHYKGQDVMMPFWVNTRFAVPGTGFLGFGARPLLLPVSHAEYEWSIRGPHINADITYYFGIDGKSEWRTMDTLDQAWVLKRAAHTYTGEKAIEVTRLAGLITVAYMHQHARRPSLPFGGYYALGVCQDGVSAIERRMTGSVTLFPNTADTALFDDERDAEVNAMMRAIPKDRGGAPPEGERIFGSLPAAPDTQGRFAAISIPGLAADLNVSYAAWKSGRLHRIHHGLLYLAAVAVGMAGAIATIALARRRAKR
ncbi:MAG TPA: hypothetical protein VM865_00785 [Acidobacteriaceae bacterium]|jgi:hypothetical protein|nr:hypothetical protein [Acidobacteriaceae bacterium]